MDLNPASGFKRRPPASSSPTGTGEIKSSSPCSPSLYLSSPSDQPSPSSSSSFVCANSSVSLNHAKGHRKGTKLARVFSTSASLAMQSLSTPKIASSDFFPHSAVQPGIVNKEDSRGREMYDPFQPTGAVKREEGKGEKYDPFDPTGSPASDADERNGKFRGIKRNCEQGDEKAEEPPDSTDTLTDLPSPCQATALSLRWRVNCHTTKAGEQRDSDGSDHSEIEEGEIVGVVDRQGSNGRPTIHMPPLNSPGIPFFVSKPERILRVLDGDGFVSVRTEGSWKVDAEPENEPVVGVEDLRSKLVSRRKERYLSFPASSPISPQPIPSPSHPPTSTPSSHLSPPIEEGGKSHKSSKSSKECQRQKSEDRKEGDEERRKKRRKDKEGPLERSKDKDRGQREVKGIRSSRSSSHKMKKRRHSSLEASRSDNSTGRKGHTGASFSSQSEERRRGRGRDKDKDINRDRFREKERHRGRERDRDGEKEHSHTISCGKDSSLQKERERKGRHHSSSRELGISKRSKRTGEKRESERDRLRERERRRDGRPVVPPSIQDLNGSDLFAIKRTITVTTTTTTTTVPGSPRLAPNSSCRPTQESNKAHKRKKRKWHSGGELEDQGRCQSRSRSLSPPRYHSYESDHFSDKLEIDVLSLDGEALDSDYPFLEDTPPAPLPPEPPMPSPKSKSTPKASRHHQKDKSHRLKKMGQPESSSSNSTKSECLSSLMVTSGSASVSSGLTSAKRGRKISKDRDKGSRKDLCRSNKSKKEGSSSRKGKLQSKVSVLVREGVSSTTGASLGNGKLGMDLLGAGGASGGAGGSVVGGSIAVVFCRDNESRSPFLKPCSEPLSLGNRTKDLANIEKRGRVAPAPASLTNPAGLKSKKTKSSSITSTSSATSSPSLSLASKRCRRPTKKTKDKGRAGGLMDGDGSKTKVTSEGWGGTSSDVLSTVGDGSKSVSPHTGQAGPVPCSSSSSSSSTIGLPPSSSPHHTPLPSMASLRGTRESSPDSQTVDSSCKTPDPCFLAEDCPAQTSPKLPVSSPSSLSISQGLSITLSTPTTKPPPPDDSPKSLNSPACLTSSAVCGLTSLSLPSSDPSSSVSSSSASKPPPSLPISSSLPWSLQTGVDCTAGGVLAREFPKIYRSL